MSSNRELLWKLPCQDCRLSQDASWPQQQLLIAATQWLFSPAGQRQSLYCSFEHLWRVLMLCKSSRRGSCISCPLHQVCMSITQGTLLSHAITVPCSSSRSQPAVNLAQGVAVAPTGMQLPQRLQTYPVTTACRGMAHTCIGQAPSWCSKEEVRD